MTTTTMTERSARRVPTPTPSGAPRAARRPSSAAAIAVARASTCSTTPSCTASPAWAPASTCSRRWSPWSSALGAVYAFPHAAPRGALRARRSSSVPSRSSTARMHAKHIAAESAATGDVTGVLALAAGVVLVGLAAAILVATPRRGRRQRPPPLGLPHRRRPRRARCSPSSRRAHRHRDHRDPQVPRAVGAPPSADYREVAFDASDGVHLSGWYRPTRNGATLLVLHGGGGDRTGAVAHAKLLARHGYGVLLYDARGRGQERGPAERVRLGLDQGHRRGDRLPEAPPGGRRRSASAASASRPAPTRWSRPPAQGADLHAVVADGAAAESFEDWRRLQGITALTPMFAAEFATVRITSGAKSGPPMEDMIKRISRAAAARLGRPRRRSTTSTSSTTATPASRPVEHWNIPDAQATPARSATRRPTTSAA